MRSLALVSAALAGVAALAGCARAERPPIEVCADGADASSAATTRATSRPILGMLMLPNTAVVLARLDPLSLRPVSRPVEVGEYHDTWSVSPDRSRIAVGTGGQGIGIEIVDLKAMKVVRQIQTGIAAEEVGWLAPRLLVAGLQRGGTVLVDPSTGRILRRWRHLSDPQVSARTPDGLVVLFPGPRPATADGTAGGPREHRRCARPSPERASRTHSPSSPRRGAVGRGRSCRRPGSGASVRFRRGRARCRDRSGDHERLLPSA